MLSADISKDIFGGGGMRDLEGGRAFEEIFTKIPPGPVSFPIPKYFLASYAQVLSSRGKKAIDDALCLGKIVVAVY